MVASNQRAGPGTERLDLIDQHEYREHTIKLIIV